MFSRFAYLLDTIKYDELFGTKKEEASHREATASNIYTTPITSKNVPFTKSSSNAIVADETEAVNMPTSEQYLNNENEKILQHKIKS